MLRIPLLTAVIVVLTTPASAQLVVHDPGNLAQAVLIAERTLREYQILWEQYQTLVRMSRGLPSMESYRTPPLVRAAHDTARWEYGRPLLDVLNAGDHSGTGYSQTTRQLRPPGVLLQQLSPAARAAVERAYATVEITDAVAQRAAHQVGVVRTYGGRLDQAIAALEADVLNSAPEYHQVTTILDKVAAGQLIGRRQDMAMNQLLSHVLDQQLARSKRLRDTEAATMNMRLAGLLHGGTATAGIVRGAANDLRTWRQP